MGEQTGVVEITPPVTIDTNQTPTNTSKESPLVGITSKEYLLRILEQKKQKELLPLELYPINPTGETMAIAGKYAGAIEDKIKAIKEELEILGKNIDKIPPDVLDLLISDINTPVDELEDGDVSQILDVIKQYGKLWTFEVDEEGDNRSYRVKGVMRWPNYKHTEHYGSIPKLILENARSKPEWTMSNEKLDSPWKTPVYIPVATRIVKI
ncbi:hypothetical protein A2865_01950 [Candidatus Woesebacteria bacterium RIFCSPHIGHO2_01_FULL_39_17]|uniref:Uncharacterized protein n=2 Tax=Candidatus Woeseibacteriota TaxID=1752722 RepID=A0A0G0QV03_9BACT|nr:MAG: hypothetical protein US72_C0001G0015 [Microgenomates group bacterium GW2011_GWC1_38_12]KKR14135.1 MAG: hypothetical protein UT40_C0005G0064 [Candidatus Woesebacteria bacterium GW2011_GWA1_39_21b]OGM22786.1 MAG: hypothetical protein A2865_01950 [Candidatus Woesebacteria bacterium RIFCSPHIGHO2_01_FULL_39_17]OGM61709.1 MAG: hypothetical protein A3A52_04100 [Candidatus Woesebacteria bacterium RIFCSPLOWO2_01_FULL_39_14]